MTVSVEFYVTFLPVLLWVRPLLSGAVPLFSIMGRGYQSKVPNRHRCFRQVVHPQLAWRLVFLLAFSLYVGNAMKVLAKVRKQS